MESICVHEQKSIIHELTQGIQMAKQLSLNLHSAEAREFFMQKILSSYDNALFVLNSGSSTEQAPPPALPPPSLPESSISSGSPGSEGFEFDHPFSGRNVTFKKRKGSIIWEDQVRVRSENGFEGNTDDGYHWRKYGQKHILGTKYPRCSYSKVQKCLATKQVQRTDKDPTVFEITYKEKHTCNHRAHSKAPPPSSPGKDEKTTNHSQHHLTLPTPSEILLTNLKANLSVNTSYLGYDTFQSPFSFPSTSFDLVYPNHYDDEPLPVYSPHFLPPTSSDSIPFSDWGSSPSLDFLDDPTDASIDFEFKNTFF